MTIELPIALEPGAIVPLYHSTGAAGMDLCVKEEVVLRPLERRLAPTGIRVAIPEGYEGQVRARSGLALRYGLAMVNAPGTIDSDYRGEIKVILINLGSEAVTLARGERVAQLVICPVARAELVITESLEASERGERGFGSTGK